MERISINDTNEIRIENTEYKNVKFVGIRIWFKDENREWRPSKSGLTIKKEQWDEFQKAIIHFEPEF